MVGFCRTHRLCETVRAFGNHVLFICPHIQQGQAHIRKMMGWLGELEQHPEHPVTCLTGVEGSLFRLALEGLAEGG